MKNSNTPEEISKNIWKYIWEGNLDKIKPLLNKYIHLSDKNFGHPIMHENAHQCAKCHKTLDIEIDSRLEGPHLCTFCSIPDGTTVWSMGNDDQPNFRSARMGGQKS